MRKNIFYSFFILLLNIFLFSKDTSASLSEEEKIEKYLCNVEPQYYYYDEEKPHFLTLSTDSRNHITFSFKKGLPYVDFKKGPLKEFKKGSFDKYSFFLNGNLNEKKFKANTLFSQEILNLNEDPVEQRSDSDIRHSAINADASHYNLELDHVLSHIRNRDHKYVFNSLKASQWGIYFSNPHATLSLSPWDRHENTIPDVPANGDVFASLTSMLSQNFSSDLNPLPDSAGLKEIKINQRFGNIGISTFSGTINFTSGEDFSFSFQNADIFFAFKEPLAFKPSGINIFQ